MATTPRQTKPTLLGAVTALMSPERSKPAEERERGKQEARDNLERYRYIDLFSPSAQSLTGRTKWQLLPKLSGAHS